MAFTHLSNQSPPIEGVYVILSTPWAEDGSLDCETLVREARFVADCGADGVLWPPAEEALRLMSHEEVRAGLEAMADALDGGNARFVVCCQGHDTADAISRIADASAIAAAHPGLPAALLVRPADDVGCEADHERFFEAVAAVNPPPVIIQTYNGRSPMQSAALLVELARRHPGIFGWFKVEGTGPDIVPCKRALVAAQPVVKTVFTGWGGRDWLYDYRCIGTRGVITQRPMYADLIVRIWRALRSGDPEADALFARFMHLRNLEETVPAPEMRGWNLYVLKRRGVFANTLSRTGRRDGDRWEVADLTLSDTDRAEVDARLAFALTTL